MALEIFWSENADKRFDEILEHIEIEWGKHTVTLFVKRVYDLLDM